MKKKTYKIIAAAAAAVILIGLGWFANALVGNPISKLLATNTAEKHLAEAYAGTDYFIEGVGYNFKDGNYLAWIKSPTSMDTAFCLYLSMFGALRQDTYYEDVLDGTNTARRLDQEYRDLTDEVLTHPAFPYECHIGYGTLEIYPEELLDDPQYEEVPAYALNQNELILDKIYDVRQLGRQAGHLVIYVDGEAVTAEAAAEILLGIKAQFDDGGIPFAAVDFTLQFPMAEDGQRPEEWIKVEEFPYDEIRPDGLADRVIAADKALKEYYTEQDAKKYKK